MFFAQRGRAQVEQGSLFEEMVIVRAGELQRFLEELFRNVNLTALHGHAAASPDDIAAGGLRGFLAHLRCLLEPLIGVGELVQAAVSGALDCKVFDERISASGS